MDGDGVGMRIEVGGLVEGVSVREDEDGMGCRDGETNVMESGNHDGGYSTVGILYGGNGC